VPLSAITASYSTSYKAAVSLVRYAAATANYTVTPRAAPLAVSTRTAAGGVVIVGYQADFGRGYEAWFAHAIDADQWRDGHSLKDNGWLSPARPKDGWAAEPSTSRS
jgi:hypothetical protein